MYRFLFSILFLSLSLSAEKKPNILFIYTDDQSHRTVSCYEEAHKWVKTPNIDKLAEQGVRFKSAYIGTWCMPSRFTMLTGLLQPRMNSVKMTGKYPASTYDPEVLKFWPKVFRENGYTTAHVGKWHTGVDTGYGRDWDYQIVWNRPGYPDNAFHYYYDQQIEENGKALGIVGGYSTDNYTKWADNYLKGKNRDSSKPWALWLCYAGSHGPFTPADRHLNEYPDFSFTPPEDVFPPRAGKPAYVENRDTWIPDENGKAILKQGTGIHGNSLKDMVRQYQQSVLAIDEGIGKIIQTLKDTGQYDNTIIIFTSDQGFAWGHHGFKLKVAPYDDNLKAPFIISYPKEYPQNKVVKSHVSGADIAPTIFEMAGIKAPWDMDGRSLMPLIKNPDLKWDYPVLMTYSVYFYGEDTQEIPTDPKKLYHKSGVPWWSSITKGKYKYIQTLVKGEIPELYDLESDPAELNNLALKDEYKETVKKLRTEMISELKRTKVGFADSLPEVGGK